MSGVDVDCGAPEPMAFTRSDLLAGAFAAWLAFVTLLLAGLAVTVIVSELAFSRSSAGGLGWLPIILVYAAAIGGGVALLVTILLLPVARLVGLALRREQRITVHVIVYALLGGVVGLVAAMVPWAVGGFAGPPAPASYVVPAIFGCAAAVGFGWWRASRFARWALRDAGAAA